MNSINHIIEIEPSPLPEKNISKISRVSERIANLSFFYIEVYTSSRLNCPLDNLQIYHIAAEMLVSCSELSTCTCIYGYRVIGHDFFLFKKISVSSVSFSRFFSLLIYRYFYYCCTCIYTFRTLTEYLWFKKTLEHVIRSYKYAVVNFLDRFLAWNKQLNRIVISPQRLDVFIYLQASNQRKTVVFHHFWNFRESWSFMVILWF